MKENDKKDYYITVVTSQIFLSVLITLLVFISGKNDKGIGDDFRKLIEQNFDSIALSASTEKISGYLEDVSSFFSKPDDFSALNGAGGTDTNENTSFSPLFTTSEICPPIKESRYTSYFGYRNNPITGKYSFHTGIDIAAPEGTNIRAAFGGRVLKSGYDSQAGNYIFLSHDDGFVTFYCHCNEIVADVGAYIRQGETIALVGETGFATGPHLHFEVRKDNIRYNPIWLLEK